ncbi:MAG: peptidase [Deltaproteobacteria bacterium HGW-Deltaproteobacteria-22]|nr:MAG: peptidase [Deltaproteobacteria bacterium HGW-Deltaproteobacteria-22]
MERIHSINPRRIEWCCQDFQVAGEQVAEQLDISRSTWEQVLAGQGGLTFGQLRRLAVYFGRGVLFFLEPAPVEEEKVHTPQFRTLANGRVDLSPELRRVIEAVEDQREAYVATLEEMDEDVRRGFVPPELVGLGPAEAAARARAWLDLTPRGGFNAYRVAVESRGVLVFRLHGHHGRWHMPSTSPVLGFSLYEPRCPVIVVLSRFTETLQAFTLMHELGHLLLHRCSSINLEAEADGAESTDRQERAANTFAGHVLVPDDFLESIRDELRPATADRYDEWLAPQRRTWGVSSEVILRRLMDVGRLSSERYGEYRNWRRSLPVSALKKGGNRAKRYREPLSLFGQPFVRTMLDAKNAGLLSLARTSTFLDGLKLADLHRLERECATR